ncbi:MAG: beta-ketoacyl-[acyl-carrier-protein] synthase family protein [Conexibacter sp.]
MSTPAEQVVVTGIGAVSPLGVGARALYEGWRDGSSGVIDGIARCSAFDPATVMTAKEVRRSDPFAQMFVAACDEALADAGWHELPCAADRIACIVGTGGGGVTTLRREHDLMYARGGGRPSPLGIPSSIGSAAAVAVSIRHGLQGETSAVNGACAAGAQAVGTGLRLIRTGAVDAAVVGGTDAVIDGYGMPAFRVMGSLSKRGVARPFDRDRDGFVIGEGAAALVLERRELCERRAARSRGIVLGYGASSDAYHLVAPRPDGSAAAIAIRRALEDAGITAAELDYVNAHATGTPLGDVAETLALRRALGADAGRIPVSSLKGSIGHLLGASGAVEAIVTLLGLAERIAGPTLTLEHPDPQLELRHVAGQARPLDPGARGIAISNSFGFGGHNAVLVLAAEGVA